MFMLQVKVNNEVATGTGPNKKVAKRNAAEAMLLQLGYKASTVPQGPVEVPPALPSYVKNQSFWRVCSFVLVVYLCSVPVALQRSLADHSLPHDAFLISIRKRRRHTWQGSVSNLTARRVESQLRAFSPTVH